MSEITMVVRRWYDQIASGGGMSAPDLVAEDADWRLMDGFPAGGAWRGRAAVFETYTPMLMSVFEDIRAYPERVTETGEMVVALGHYRGKTKRTGTPFEIPFAHVWRVENGRIAALRQYTDTLLFAAALAGASVPTSPAMSAEGKDAT